MDKISVRMTDAVGSQGSASKSDSSARAVTDDFRKLLQGQERQADSKEVSKKDDTKTEDSPEKTQDTKEVKDTKDEKEEPAKDEKAPETVSQTEGLLAVYQMDLEMRPEVVKVQPETALEDSTPGIKAEITTETETGIDAQQLQAEPQAELQTVQPEALPEADVPQMIRPETKTETKAAEQPETAVISQTGQKIQTPVKNESSSGGKDNSQAQPESHMAEQTAQTPVTQAQPEVQSVKQEEPVRMYVPQPEVLPEKVADQLLAKISEGVQEFEIHIEPANLGKIAVKILYQEGQATISIMCTEKRALDMLGRSAGELGQVIEKNLGGTTTIIVDKQESDYLNQQKDENQQNGQDAQQNQQKESKNEKSPEDAEQFLQKLRLGLAG